MRQGSTRCRGLSDHSCPCVGAPVNRCAYRATRRGRTSTPTTPTSTGYNDRDGRPPAEAPVMPDAPPAPAPLIDVRGLGFARDDVPLFGPLAFSVEAGEALLVQGDNGAGKPTLL